MWSIGFERVLPCLAAKPFFGGVTTPTGPHSMIVRLGSRVFGLTLLGQMTPCGMVPSFDHPYPRGCVSSRGSSSCSSGEGSTPHGGGGVVSCLRVKREKPFQPGLERLWSPGFRNLPGRGHVILIILLYQVGHHEVRPLRSRTTMAITWCPRGPRVHVVRFAP
jgi:hypothetical protein